MKNHIIKMEKEYIIPYVKSFVTLIIIIGIVLASYYFIKNQYEDEKIETIKTDMLLIEAKIKIIEEEVNMKKKGIAYIGTKASEMEEDEEIKKLIDNQIVDITSKDHNYYVLTQENLQELELTEVTLEEGYYVVDYKTEEVIVTKGIQDQEGNILYKLSDIQKIGNEKKLDKTEVKEDSKEEKQTNQEK